MAGPSLLWASQLTWELFVAPAWRLEQAIVHDVARLLVKLTPPKLASKWETRSQLAQESPLDAASSRASTLQLKAQSHSLRLMALPLPLSMFRPFALSALLPPQLLS
jgi:hypothetical protein